MWTQEEIIQELHKRGKRVTQQRRELIEIILETDWTSSKEIYYEAVRQGQNIGMATVYRMLNVLEEIGAVDRRSYQMVNEDKEPVSIILHPGKTDEKNKDLCQKIESVLRENGCLEDQEFSIVIRVES
ncbi:transcriptional repressor [Ruminococcus sp. OA3]|uniref:Fur family transcriptional regulator n=1 Tax=Ruminococcus sp. OA3 TaxID=2914164 RepID=UPI001F0704C6|nr:transcriptional repressor [Ruminococcus sp. OA3]MCH1982797.1 transcriptional repressor [Ruminococcus sp. OA3]